MVRIRPFAALRPRPDVAERVAAVPYDVVNRAEAKTLAEGEPLSFLHVTRAEIDLPDDVDAHDDRVYARAGEALAHLEREGVLVREEVPALYLYRQEATVVGRKITQTGIFGCCHVDDYRNGVIKRHELTRKAKEDDRTKHMLAVGAHAGPVFLAHRAKPELTRLVVRARKGAPLYDFTAPDGVRHAIWRIDDPAPFEKAFGKLEAAYVADGHHRAASAARAAEAAREGGDGEDAESQWFPCVLFASDELNVLPYHRIVRTLPEGMDAFELHRRLGEVGELGHIHEAPRMSSDKIGVFLTGHWHTLKLKGVPDPYVDPVRALPYVQLTERVLTPVLGIEDLRADPRIDFVGGIRGTDELERLVGQGDAAVAFSMPAVSVEQMMRVADAGAIMPPKSTWFEPKLRSGLLVHPFANR